MMKKISLTIDGKKLTGSEGQTILDIACENGIDIPTLCHDERIEAFGACGICAVEADGSGKLLRACSVAASDGMILHTGTERVLENRRSVLELLLSDHTGDCRASCMLACPAGTDCQGYVGLIANGEHEQAAMLIRDKIPLPASIGMVCPHPCEEACRRQLVEHPIAIAALKRFAGEFILSGDTPGFPAPEKESGKRVAVIGGGPGGLSAACFLRAEGHEVSVFEAMPEMGGMLRYGIPEYRLPKALLDKEISLIEQMGVRFLTGVKIGRDITLETLRGEHDAVIVAVGAWRSTGLRCPGEELDGVVGGIDFLRNAALERPSLAGKKVAVVGGGNTAMDACRTAVRLGAAEVYNIYRRTKNEMPAEALEIEEAQEEGVVFKNLTNPIRVDGEDGKVKSITLQIMELGEPDASGRRAPVPVKGQEETLPVDMVITAIGQKPALAGLEALETTGWGTIAAGEQNFLTNLEGVFAAGDATNNGADIAVTAIGEAKKAAEMAGRYLNGEPLSYEPPFLVKSEKTAEDFADRAKEPRIEAPVRPAGERRRDFAEVAPVMTERQAQAEASRCLECGCMDYFECRLVDYANKYRVRPGKYGGKIHRRKAETTHPNINREPEKCVLCGMCVRICEETVGACALGLLGRGFDTAVTPALEQPLENTDCIACGMCAAVCPVGAITEKTMAAKQTPLSEDVTETVCPFCSVGCRMELTTKGELILRALPCEKDGGLLCKKGRFGFGDSGEAARVSVPMLRRGGKLEQTDLEQAGAHVTDKFKSINDRYGSGSVAAAISCGYTNEEALAAIDYARKELGIEEVFCFGQTAEGLSEVLSRDASSAGWEELKSAEWIVAVSPDDIMENYAVAGMRIRQAVKGGAKLLLISEKESLLDSAADIILRTHEEPEVLASLFEALLELYPREKLEAHDGLQAVIKNSGLFSASGRIHCDNETMNAAKLLTDAGRAVFIYGRSAVTADTERLIAGAAVLSGHGQGEGGGILRLLSGANSQGLIDIGVKSGGECINAISGGKIKGMFIFGEDVNNAGLEKLEFLAVRDTHMTKTAALADALFPASEILEQGGTFTGADGIKREFAAVQKSPETL